MTRWSIPSYRPHRSVSSGSPRQLLRHLLREQPPRRGQVHRPAPAGTDVASSAAAIGSGFITMPGPPPYAASSQTWCLSTAKSRMSTSRTADEPPRDGPRQDGALQESLEEPREKGEDRDCHRMISSSLRKIFPFPRSTSPMK